MSATTNNRETKATAFADRLLDILNHGAIALMVSIGHRTHLFDAMGDGGWTTSEALARKAGLNERYVREWLGALVTGKVVEYDATARSYRLPAEDAACLTRAAGPNNFAPFMQYIAVLGAVEDGIVDCFKRGGGVPYSDFHRFHEIMAEDSGQTVLPALNMGKVHSFTLVGAGGRVLARVQGRQARFDLGGVARGGFGRVVVSDSQGHKAWTQPERVP